MKMNRIETALMNNPVRAFVQRNHEAAMMEGFGGRVEGLKVLEIGCGRGIGTEIIFERFGAGEVDAFDLDPKMIELAHNRLTKVPPERLRLYVGDAEKINAADATYEGLHHMLLIVNTPVVGRFTPKLSGEVTFTCGMNMMGGKLIVQ